MQLCCRTAPCISFRARISLYMPCLARTAELIFDSKLTSIAMDLAASPSPPCFLGRF